MLRVLSKMVQTPICGQLSSNCRTIDASGGDITLRNARKAFPNSPSHLTTRSAASNLASCLVGDQSRRAMIIGHGEPGTTITGSGAIKGDKDKCIGFDNIADWDEILKKYLTGSVDELTLCSCNTGAGKDGADLLMAVSEAIGATASAFTGQIFVDAAGNITCEDPPGVWQHAHPQTNLIPVSSPYHKFGQIMLLKLKYADEYRLVPMEDVVTAVFDPSELVNSETDSREPGHAEADQRFRHIFSIDGLAAQQFVGMINLAEPVEIAGAPLAVTTGTLAMEYLLNERRDRRTFRVYNDRLLFDKTTSNVFYYASSDFTEAVFQFRSQVR